MKDIVETVDYDYVDYGASWKTKKWLTCGLCGKKIRPGEMVYYAYYNGDENRRKVEHVYCVVEAAIKNTSVRMVSGRKNGKSQQ